MNSSDDFEIDNKFEQTYFRIITKFLKRESGVDEFIDEYMSRWKADINTTSDERFRRIINRLFTSCDCYGAEPNKKYYEISEDELWDEVHLLSYIWWGYIVPIDKR